MAEAKRRKQCDKENVVSQNNINTSGVKAGKSVEEIYQKKSQREHILLRPDSYVGSVELQSQDHWVYDEKAKSMVRKKIEYVPALYKIFDEILVNAADNMVRCPEQDEIRVEIKTAEGCVSVWNNGSGLPVQMHQEHKCYVPELVFGHLLTSDNYDDSERKVTGGRNGYGSKLTNIFSTRFILETQDSRSGKRYKQVWEKNMTVCKPPEIKPASGGDFTQVTFFPDLKRFMMSSLDADIAALMRRRAYDVAAATHGRCKVFLDRKELSVKSFEDYVALHLKPESFRICEVVNDRWEVAVGLTDGSGMQQVSFVNSISTFRGGTHVNYIADQIVSSVVDHMSKQKSAGTLAVKASNVKGYIWVFVNCLIENPAFDSQTKETLTSKKDRFGSTCELPEHFLGAILESGLIDILQEWSKAMSRSELAQHLNRSEFGMVQRLHGVPKLEDANKAGTKESGECTLILTEGDSAKALAVAGLGVVGRDHYGVFPLRGKLRNVRELTIKQMLENKELDQLFKIMAFDATKDYTDTKALRYGSIMIMTDQDFDGSHIKGLIINFIEKWFPSLLTLPGFLKEFVTPIVKVSKGDDTQTFFTIPEYEEWKEANGGGQGWKTKYYKGLGTSTSKEAKEYFSDLDTHEIQFAYNGEEDNQLIDMAFNPKRADDRKLWIQGCEEGTYVDHSQPELSYSDFILRELVLYAKYDVERMIPCMVDGLKVGQRKVLFGAFKKKITSDIKVAQLSGYVAEHSAYHHGEASLQGTIISLAQTFVGSNNVNLLVPSGQFGTRLQGGKDHAASRYIFTRLSRTARCLFPEEDDAVLEYKQEEGMSIEPQWYCPIIPFALANGAEGIGTGWSTSVPNFSPRDIIANVRKALRKESLEPMIPWYRGFKGTISPVPGMANKFDCFGTAVKRGRMRMEITELPIRRWTQDYKEWLMEQLPQQGDDKRASVTELREHHTENSVHFVLSMTPDKLAEAERRGLERVFHLKSSISTSNMYFFDHEGELKKYSSPEEVIEAFVPVRLQVYQKRKDFLLAKMARELDVISNRLRFVRLVVTDQLQVERRKTPELCKEMQKHGLKTMLEIEGGAAPPLEEMAGKEGFKYLLSMKMWSLTDEKVAELERLHADKTSKMEELRNTSLETLWEVDLVKLEAALDANDREDAKEAEAAAKMAAKISGDNSLVNQQCVLVLSRNFRAKRVRASTWQASTKGKQLGGKTCLLDKKTSSKVLGDGEDEAAEEDAEDAADALSGVFCCYDFDALLVFSDRGQVFMLQALDVPLAKKASAQGTPLTEFLPELGQQGKVTALITVPQGRLKDQSEEFVVLVTAQGMASKVALTRFSALRPGKGIQAMKVADDDSLRWVHRASSNCALVLATALGAVNRIALATWRIGTTKGPGKRAVKLRSGKGDTVASSAIHEMSREEIKEVMAKKKTMAPGAPATANDGAVGAEGGGVDGATKAIPSASAGAAAEEEEASEAESADEDGANDEEEDEQEAESDGEKPNHQQDSVVAATSGEDAKDIDVDMEASQKVPEDAEVIRGAKEEERCILLVTEQGFGLRAPLMSNRFKLKTTGSCGRNSIKVKDNDRVAFVGVVSSAQEVKKPKPPPKNAFYIWFSETQSAKKIGEGDQDGKEDMETTLPTQDEEALDAQAPKSEAPDGQIPKGFERVHMLREQFKNLPDEEQQVYLDRLEEWKQRYAQELETYQQMQQEELLLGSAAGLVTRIVVPSIPVTGRCNRGTKIVKCKKGDKICAVSLLSSMDVEGDDEARASVAPTAAPPRQRQRAAPTARRAASSSVGPGSGLASTSTVSTPGTPPRRPLIGDAGAPSFPPLSLTPPAAATGGSIRRVSKVATPLRRFGISKLAMSMRPRPPTPGRSMACSPKRARLGARLTILKPKLRRLGERRQSIRAVDIPLGEWARIEG